MWGTEFYQRSNSDLLAEISYYREKYNIDNVDFVDLVGILNKNKILTFAQSLIEHHPDISWNLAPGTRIESLSTETLAIMKKSNILKMQFAPETGSKK